VILVNPVRLDGTFAPEVPAGSAGVFFNGRPDERRLVAETPSVRDAVPGHVPYEHS